MIDIKLKPGVQYGDIIYYMNEYFKYTTTSQFTELPGDVQILEVNKAMGKIVSNYMIIKNMYDDDSITKSAFISDNFKISWCEDNDIGYISNVPSDIIVEYFTNLKSGVEHVNGIQCSHQFGGNKNIILSYLNRENLNECINSSDVSRYIMKKHQITDCYGFNYDALFKHCFDLHYKLCDILIKSVHKLIDSENEPLSQEWTTATMYLRFKGGNPIDMSRYRPLIALPGMVRLFDFVLMNFIHQFCIVNNLIDSDVQKGHLTNTNGCWEHRIEVNKRLLELSANKSSDIVMFLDVKNAFGSVNYDLMWYILEKLKFPHQVITYIKKFYNGLKVKYNDVEFAWTNGLLQGSAVSNILFLIYMDQAVKHFHQMGVKEKLFNYAEMRHNSFVFVDDTTFIFKRNDKLKPIMDVLTTSFKNFGMSIAPNKSYYVEFINQDVELKIGDDIIKRAPNDFKYLGHPLVISPIFLSIVKDKIVDKINLISSMPISPVVKLFVYQYAISIRLNVFLELCTVLKIDFSEIEIIENKFFENTGVAYNRLFLISRAHKLIALLYEKLLHALSVDLNVMAKDVLKSSHGKHNYLINHTTDKFKELIIESINIMKTDPVWSTKYVSGKKSSFYPNCFVEHID